MMGIGYACQLIGVPETSQRSLVMKNYTEELLTQVIRSNLEALDQIMTYNIEQQITLFRISSDLIPFGSNEINTVPWWETFKTEFQEIGNKAKRAGIRLSMHPGQYTVINSPKEDVVERAFLDLEYHAKVLDAMEMGLECKLVLHIGGVYGEKEIAIDRFIKRYQELSAVVKKRLVIENDDKNYTVEEVLKIGKSQGIPVIFDNLHHELNPPEERYTETYWIQKCMETWKVQDGRPKIHYSQQDQGKKKGSHSKTINATLFHAFYTRIKEFDLDIMLEVKDKNLSVVKCMNVIANEHQNKKLEVEWSKYKYTILEHSHKKYLEIRQLLREQNKYPVFVFYSLIEEAMGMEVSKGGAVNTADHVWGYFKKVATAKEKEQYLKKVKAFQEGTLSLASLKRFLWKMTCQYQEHYLLSSYYFYLE